MRCPKIAAALGLLSLMWLQSESLANGVVRDGIGAISIGRGGLNLGYADNGAIILDNPAAMTNIAGDRLMELGLDTVICDIGYVDADNSVDNEVKAFPAGMFGLVQRKEDSPWAFGLGVFAPAGFGAEFTMQNPDVGEARYKSLGMLGKFLPAVAVQVTDELSVGANLGLALCHAELEGPFYTQTGPGRGTPSFFDLQATDATICGGVGLQYILTPSTTIGLAYTEETRFDFEGNAQVDLGPIDSAFDCRTDIIWPRSLGLGLKHDLSCCHRVGFEALWYDWSSAFRQMDMVLSNPSNPMLAGTVIRDTFPMNWKDSVSYKFGYEWQPSYRLTCRFGYIYHESPAPDETLNPYLDGVLEHVFSAGLGYNFDKAILNVAYQYGFHSPRHVGTQTLAGGDFDNSTLDADAHWAAVSVLVPY